MWVEREEVLGGLLKIIGNYRANFFKDVFDDRLILQKTIYLLQAFGLHLGYFFNFYIRGPYSPQLARAGYRLSEIFDQCPIVKFVKPKSGGRFYQFLQFLGDRKRDPDWLERLASIHFICRVYPRLSKNEIFKILHGKQPHFTAEKLEEAWNYLERYGLLSTK